MEITIDEPKYKNIPKFKGRGNYHINLFLNDIIGWLDRFAKYDQKVILNPDFQRGHVWTEEQQISYVEYLLRGGMSGTDIYFNCEHWHAGEANDVICVDGLQRLTACLRFVRNEIAIFGGWYYKDFNETIGVFDCSALDIYINDLPTRADVLEWYLELNFAGTPHKDTELERVSKLLKMEQERI